MVKVTPQLENIGDYYLVLSKLSELSESEKEQVHSYYRDMLHYCQEDNYHIASSFFNTLDMAGYIKNRTQEERAEKLDFICG